MSADVLTFRARDDKGVRETLLEAVEENYDEVVVVGIKDGVVSTSKSETVSAVQWIGCLEFLKMWLYERM